MTAFAYLVFPNTTLSVLPEVEGEPVEHGIITSVTHGVMSGNLLMNRIHYARRLGFSTTA